MNLLPKPGGSFSCYVLLKQGLPRADCLALNSARTKADFQLGPSCFCPLSNPEPIVGGLKQGHVTQAGFF